MAGHKRENYQTEKRRSASKIIEIEEAQERRRAKRAELLKQEKVQRRRERSLQKANRPKMSLGKKFAVLGVIVVAALIFVTSGYRIIGLNLDKNVYEKRYEERLAEKERLEKELSLVDDPEYIEHQARSLFSMVHDYETLYVFPEAEPIEAQ